MSSFVREKRKDKGSIMIVAEGIYDVGDLLMRNQKKTVPGVKSKIVRHWNEPWIITEKLCVVPSKICYLESSTPVIVHGDNLKRVHGDSNLHIPQEHNETTEVRQPNMRDLIPNNTVNEQ
ncbi:hypothetical protein DPMN_046173 [Dreissena polymorpha]|uniref:Uncharacterized protein n=1 Tax=Dreissena polymorpha TaxID=45954 RepID=A0A9D4D7X6_DREPO|nr:hypothetical protein DPMN_046173 [Dreissena polymorpha]